MTAEFTLHTVRSLLGQYAFRYSSEVQLHERIADVLSDAGLSFQREVDLDDKNRADFVVDGGIVIEVKVDGDLGSAIAQCMRYASLDGVQGVLLASACGWARGLPEYVRASNPIQVVHLKRQAL